jgi:hypothetical protein
MKLLLLLLVFSCGQKHKTKLEETYKKEEITLPDDDEIDELPESPGQGKTQN